jgi:tripartite-type tricarboxylate transporter receptor subunit TctC
MTRHFVPALRAASIAACQKRATAPTGRNRVRRLAAMAGAVMLLSGTAHGAEPAPAPITLIVPAPEGGSGDRVAHVVAQELETVTEVPVQLRYIPGLYGVAGLNAVAHAGKDGKTLGLSLSTPLIAGKLLSGQADYNPVDDFDWLAILGSYGNAVVVRADNPALTMADWVRRAGTAPKALRYGMAGTASAGHLAGEYLRTEHNARLVPVPYESVAQAYAQLASGELDVLFDGVPSAMVNARGSDFRVLAVTSAKRDPSMPKVEAFGEIWPGQHFDIWAGVIAPQGLAPEARARLAAAVSVMLLDKELPGKLATLGFTFIGLGGADARQFVRDELVRQAGMIARLAIAPDAKAEPR